MLLTSREENGEKRPTVAALTYSGMKMLLFGFLFQLSTKGFITTDDISNKHLE